MTRNDLNDGEWRLHMVSASLTVRVGRSMPALPQALDERVKDIWAREQAARGGALFNGRVFSADAIAPAAIVGHWSEYRRVVAQMRDASLFAALGIRPLAVGGIIEGPDGFLFGRRPDDAVYQPGEWQLPPAGSVDDGAAGPDGAVDVHAMLLRELGEEVGLDAADVSAPQPVALVEHPGSHVLDLGMTLRTGLSHVAIAAAAARHGNGEYADLVSVPRNALAQFLNSHRVTRQGPMFLACLGLPLPPQANGSPT